MFKSVQLQEISFIEILPEGVLNIIGTQEIDAGDYDCVAANEAGTAKETVRLEVGGKWKVNPVLDLNGCHVNVGVFL